jgi:DNA-binding PadR family transcriptional regulator
MPLHHAVLALLTEGPSHGYELKGRFEETIGPQWGGLNIGHLYQILDRLVRDSFVTRSQVAQSDRPDKTLYSLTASGQDELREWATSAWVRTGGFRDELFLKLVGASSLGPDALDAFIAAQSRSYLAELAGLTRLRRSHTGAPPGGPPDRRGHRPHQGRSATGRGCRRAARSARRGERPRGDTGRRARSGG